MSFTDIPDELPRLAFEERQELIRRAIERDDEPMSRDEDALLGERMKEFRRDPEAGVSIEDLKSHVLDRLRGR